MASAVVDIWIDPEDCYPPTKEWMDDVLADIDEGVTLSIDTLVDGTGGAVLVIKPSTIVGRSKFSAVFGPGYDLGEAGCFGVRLGNKQIKDLICALKLAEKV